MRFSAVIVGFTLVVSLCEAALIQRRTNRNTDEILVPVAIIQDGEDFRGSADVKENETVPQIMPVATEAIAENLAAAVEEEQKLEAIAAVVEAERRIDEAIVEEEIKEAVQQDQDKQITKTIQDKEEIRTSLSEEAQIVVVLPSEAAQDLEKPVEGTEEKEKVLNLKSIVIERESPDRVVVVIDTKNSEAEQPEEAIRQATQAPPTPTPILIPTQTSTQQNFVQQLIQNSPLGQFFSQITGQTQVVSDEAVTASPAPAPALPGLFNPVTAVQTAAQSVVNSTTQAFQGLQQFASNLGNQFQNTLSGLGGQQQQQQQPQTENDATTARPAGPIQQLVNTFIGNTQQTPPAPVPQGPLQGLLNIFQGNNRPQGASASINDNIDPIQRPQAEAQPPIEAQYHAEEQPHDEKQSQAENADAASAIHTADQISNEVRDSSENNDSFEEIVKPEELIVVNDNTPQTENDQVQYQVPYTYGQ